MSHYSKKTPTQTYFLVSSVLTSSVGGTTIQEKNETEIRVECTLYVVIIRRIEV